MSRVKPQRAMILAAGYGTRMEPISHDLPKAILPLWNQSLLARNVALLTSWGVREICVNAHHGAEQVIREALTLSDQRCRITISHEPDILGTGGALRKAKWFFDDQPFWLINADVAARLAPSPILQAFTRHGKTIASLWLQAERGPRTVEMKHGRITQFASNRAGTPGTYTFTGLHLLTRHILTYLPDTGFASIIDAYEKAMRDGWRICGTTVDGSYWSDVGTPERYLQTHQECAPHGENICVAPTAHVHPSASLNHCVIMDGARVDAHARVENAIVARHTHVRGALTGIAVQAKHGLRPAERTALHTLGWEPDQATFVQLPARGSARQFIRLYDRSHRAILMRYDATRAENVFYTTQARFLAKHGWPVPTVLHDNPRDAWSLMEDIGDDALEERAHGATRSTILRWYKCVLDEVLRLHGSITKAFRRARVPTMPPFGPDLYRYEQDLFIDHFLRNRLKVDDATCLKVERDLQCVARNLRDVTPVLLHRDLQSSNIFFVRGKPHFIDFQGMRFGPAAYDMASLLCDPYVALPYSVREALLNYYAARVDRRVFDVEQYRWACVQRLCQAIGAYARLGALPGCARFLKHIPAAAALLKESLDQLPGLRGLKSTLSTARRDASPYHPSRQSEPSG